MSVYEVLHTGNGNVGRHYQNVYKALGVEVVGVVSGSPYSADRVQATLERFGLQGQNNLVFPNVRVGMQQTGAKIVTVASADHDHYTQALAAINEGALAVMVEKPIALTYAEAFHLNFVAEDLGVRLFVNTPLVWHPKWLEFVQMVFIDPDDPIVSVVYISQGEPRKGGEWKKDQLVTFDLLPHFAQFAYELGFPEISNLPFERISEEEGVEFVTLHQAEVVIRICIARKAGIGEQHKMIVCTKKGKTYQLDMDRPDGWTIQDGDNASGITRTGSPVFFNPFIEHYRRFLENDPGKYSLVPQFYAVSLAEKILTST